MKKIIFRSFIFMLFLHNLSFFLDASSKEIIENPPVKITASLSWTQKDNIPPTVRFGIVDMNKLFIYYKNKQVEDKLPGTIEMDLEEWKKNGEKLHFSTMLKISAKHEKNQLYECLTTLEQLQKDIKQEIKPGDHIRIEVNLANFRKNEDPNEVSQMTCQLNPIYN